jgi:thermitase
VVVVACMMNTNSSTIYYPAGYPGVIAVGATNPNDTRCNPFFWSTTSGSNYGSHISVVAPGNYIYGLNYQSDTNYGSYWGGTSQATPLVSGLAGILLALNPKRTPAQIKAIIEVTADDLTGMPSEDTPGKDDYYGFGRINALKALTFPTNVEVTLSKPTGFNVFPNPTSGIFTIIAPTIIDKIRIFNSSGILLQNTKVFQKKQQFELYENGIYFIEIWIGNQRSIKRLIVNR